MRVTTILGVNEIFETIQGEATFTGTPAVFVRLQGCDVGCPWCDTKHTWKLDPAMQVERLVSIVTKIEDTPLYARVSAEQLAQMLTGYDARHVVITGGEPCNYDLAELTERLIKMGRTVQVETSGTEPVRVAEKAWVTLSPKIDMPGRKKVRQDAVDLCNEIKMPVGKWRDVERLIDFVRKYDANHATIWLQPLSQSEKATNVCIQAATQHGWRISVQTHKYLGVR